jgi:hypothetical protein
VFTGQLVASQFGAAIGFFHFPFVALAALSLVQMFNRQYHLQAVRNAGGGHQVAEDFYRPRHRVRPGKPAARFESQQLELFPTLLMKSSLAMTMAPPIVCKSTPDPSRPLFDLFPEAYS